ncbi:AEC family transporter [Ideonella livida]|uniref:AEC family transporter n=1 Tax=Ideonella livida TaxID=2707176 RepID=A0A7C9TJG8_9BURK|nr:AEC family transporter [Ideonella livida]NDY90943.1 AEC family transporter [Ideonella livida]
MNSLLLGKLLAIVAVAALGWGVGKLRWLGDERADPARVLSNAAFYLFAPALLFRTTARVDLGSLPWRMLAAFFVPAVLAMLLTYALGRWRQRGQPQAPCEAPAVQAITVTFGNSVQIGIPLAAALFGEAGLALHLTLVSLHAVVLLVVATTLVEADIARASGQGHLAAMLGRTLRQTVIHPVVLPVLAGLAWNLVGLPLPGPLDELLQVLGSAVVPLCLTLIGMSLAYLGWPARWRSALELVLLKVLVLPAAVLAVAHWGFGLGGLPLGVVVILACLPSGSNALMFAQRYRVLEQEVTAAVVLSTLLVLLAVPLWLAVLQHLP